MSSIIFHVSRKQYGKHKPLCQHLKPGYIMPEDEGPLQARAEWRDNPWAICVDCARCMKPGRKFFCVVYETWGRDSEGRMMWKPGGFCYNHADNENDSRFQFWTVNNSLTTRIVACAEVFEYHRDSNGTVLAV